jgi:hypothetical protein
MRYMLVSILARDVVVSPSHFMRLSGVACARAPKFCQQAVAQAVAVTNKALSAVDTERINNINWAVKPELTKVEDSYSHVYNLRAVPQISLERWTVSTRSLAYAQNY